MIIVMIMYIAEALAAVLSALAPCGPEVEKEALGVYDHYYYYYYYYYYYHYYYY